MSDTLTQHPPSILALAKRLGINPDQFINESHVGRRGFFRYGRKIADACRYCLEGERIIGLALRGQNITKLDDLLEDEAFSHLEDLLLGENAFSHLEIPATWTKLRRVDLSYSPQLQQVSFAGPADALERLEITDAGLTQLSLPTTGCPKLQFIDLSRSEIKELVLYGPCSSLHSLHLRDAPKFEHLTINTPLPALDTLELKGCAKLRELPEEVILKSPLERLYAQGCAPRNCPAVFLQKKQNSVDQVRTWFRALQGGSTENRIVKLLINGNGNVGKSTLWCALKNTAASACTCADHPTTHGIELTVEALLLNDVEFRGWDFGGQEIYQGTHRLFLTDGAVQVLVLDYESEKAAQTGDPVKDRSGGTDGKPDKWVRNFPLQHFYQRQKALGPSSKFVIVQTKKGAGHARHPAALHLEKEASLPYEYLDAKAANGVETLRVNLKNIARELPIHGMRFPKSWLDVREWLAENLREQEPLRVMNKADFHTKVVKDFKVIDDESMIDALLTFLHAAGDVYVNEQHLKDRIIIDLRWALEGIYRPLKRGKFQRRATRDRGKLHVKDIFPKNSEAEQELFLEFMQSCGMCFPADPKSSSGQKNEFYIFPNFLSPEPEVRVKHAWEKIAEPLSWSAQLPYRDLPAIHALICDLGRKTTEGQLWTSGIDLILTDNREERPENEPLPKVQCKIELLGGAENDRDSCRLVVSLDDVAGAGWFPSIKEWIGEHFRDLKWVGNEAARTQVQEDVVKSKGQNTVTTAALVEIIGTEPVAVWFVAHPCGHKKVSFNEEFGRVKSRMSALDSIARIETATSATVQSLKDRTRKHKPRIIHFMGHGTMNNTLVFHEENGPGEVQVDAAKFGRYIETIRKYAPLEAVVLNACFSSEFALEVSRQGIYVIGTEDSLKNETAITFSGEFYAHYFRPGASMEDAFRAATEHVYEEHGKRAEDYHLYFNGEDISSKFRG